MTALHAVPEMVRVKEAIELGIQVDDIDASLCGISNNGTGKVASVVVLFGIDAQAAVYTQFQSGHVCQLFSSEHVWHCITYTSSSSALFSALSSSSP